MRDLRLEWVTPAPRPPGFSSASWVVLRLTVLAIDDDSFQSELWGPESSQSWESILVQLANDLEDWVCETSFAWGEQHLATVPSRPAAVRAVLPMCDHRRT
jgi:hypothetical protein